MSKYTLKCNKCSYSINVRIDFCYCPSYYKLIPGKEPPPDTIIYKVYRCPKCLKIYNKRKEGYLSEFFINEGFFCEKCETNCEDISSTVESLSSKGKIFEIKEDIVKSMKVLEEILKNEELSTNLIEENLEKMARILDDIEEIFKKLMIDEKLGSLKCPKCKEGYLFVTECHEISKTKN
ncbi:hypothetical protein [uncultured Ilyobacter sp.]|uniref:hypothetical protein n=1 Tax=uncultured Ilyobacter sp. TaxID=544433 RepID=UPI0029C0234D|nr:hypothetical protein [uncultured Ilyobacter sp.]